LYFGVDKKTPVQIQTRLAARVLSRDGSRKIRADVLKRRRGGGSTRLVEMKASLAKMHLHIV
jgi:hypothetical protein